MSHAAVNSVLAGILFLVALASIRAMDKATCHAIRLSILFVAIAGIGQACAYWLSAGGAYLDTWLYGGVLAFLFACKRTGKWIKPPAACFLSVGTLCLTVTIMIVSYFAGS